MAKDCDGDSVTQERVRVTGGEIRYGDPYPNDQSEELDAERCSGVTARSQMG